MNRDTMSTHIYAVVYIAFEIYIRPHSMVPQNITIGKQRTITVTDILSVIKNTRFKSKILGLYLFIVVYPKTRKL